MKILKKWAQYRRITMQLKEIQSTTVDIFELRTAINRLNKIDELWQANQLKESS